MNSVKKANLLIIIIIAVVGLGVGNVLASFTGDYVKDNINLNFINFSEDSKMLTVEDGQFSPVTVDKQPIAPINDTPAPVNNTTDTNSTNDTHNNTSKHN